MIIRSEFPQQKWLCQANHPYSLYGFSIQCHPINPSPQIKLCRNTMGFFIAHSLGEVKR